MISWLWLIPACAASFMLGLGLGLVLMAAVTISSRADDAEGNG